MDKNTYVNEFTRLSDEIVNDIFIRSTDEINQIGMIIDGLNRQHDDFNVNSYMVDLQLIKFKLDELQKLTGSFKLKHNV